MVDGISHLSVELVAERQQAQHCGHDGPGRLDGGVHLEGDSQVIACSGPQ